MEDAISAARMAFVMTGLAAAAWEKSQKDAKPAKPQRARKSIGGFQIV